MYGQGCEPKVENGSVGFSVSHQKAGRFRSVFQKKPKKTETETEHLSVGFSVGFSAKPAKWSTFRRVRCVFVGIICEDVIVWCEVAFLQYLRLLRQTGRADTRAYNLPQTIIATGSICYKNKKMVRGRVGTWLGCHNVS